MVPGVKPAYQTDTDEAAEICGELGWPFAERRIQTKRRGTTINVTGILLRPREWRRLISDCPSALADGTKVILSRVPSEFRREMAQRNGLAMMPDDWLGNR